jgi:hypothetical protein
MMRPITLLVAAGLLACSDTLAPIAGPLSVGLSLAKPEIVRGTPVEVIVVARNVSSTAIHVQPFCIRDFSVRDMRGVNVPLPGVICTAAVIQANLLPGDSLILRDHWDGAAATQDGHEVFAPPGDYLLTGRVRAADVNGVIPEAFSRPLRVRLK